MSDYHVFGRDKLLNGLAWLGEIKIIRPFDSTRTCEVMIPFWCSGKSLDGKTVKLRRKLFITLAKWQVKSFYFEDKPLGFFRQLFTWLLWSTLAPFLIIGLFVHMIGYKWAEILRGVLLVPLAGYYGYVCFGEWAAVFLSVTFIIIFNIIYMNLKVSAKN